MRTDRHGEANIEECLEQTKYKNNGTCVWNIIKQNPGMCHIQSDGLGLWLTARMADVTLSAMYRISKIMRLLVYLFFEIAILFHTSMFFSCYGHFTVTSG
jgi:hypothetical protein